LGEILRNKNAVSYSAANSTEVDPVLMWKSKTWHKAKW